MVKLQAAKCPSCGADIQVNDKLENTICQYCGSTVLVEDAIEKYKIELSGNVKVEGIKGRSDKLNQAKKHHKYNEFAKAKKLVQEIVAEDNFDVEAYCELVRIDIDLLKKENVFDFARCPEVQWDKWLIVKQMFNNYERIEKIDENKIMEKELADYMDDIKKYQDYKTELDEVNERLSGFFEKQNELVEKAKKIDGEATQRLFKTFKESFKLNSDLSAYGVMTMGTVLRKDGTICEKADGGKFLESTEPTESVEQMEERINAYLEKADAIVNKSAKKGLLKGKFSLGGWIVLFLITGAFSFALGSYTISLFVNKHIFGGILFVVFIDSWLFLYPFITCLGALGNIVDTLKHGKEVKSTLKK